MSDQTDEKGRPMTYWGGIEQTATIKTDNTQALYNALAEIDVHQSEIDYLDCEIKRLKRQVTVLRELAIAMKNTQYHARVNEALAAAEAIDKGE